MARRELHKVQGRVVEAVVSFLGRIKGDVRTLRKIATPGILEDETVVERVRLGYHCARSHIFLELMGAVDYDAFGPGERTPARREKIKVSGVCAKISRGIHVAPTSGRPFLSASSIFISSTESEI
jgi:hypothetical protein